MNLSDFIGVNYKIIACGALIAFLVFSGWHARGIYDDNQKKSVVIAAQANVIKKDEQSTTLFNKIGGDYDQQTKTVLNDYYANPHRLPVQANGNMSAYAPPASPATKCTPDRKLETNYALCKIAVHDLKKAYNGQRAIINAK